MAKGRFTVKLELRVSPPAVGRRLRDVALRAATETVELDMIPDAVRGSPVKTGRNRRSISGDARFGPTGHVEGRLFTESGYGGYLEVGTARMAARPYLAPAVEKHAQTMLNRVRRSLR